MCGYHDVMPSTSVGKFDPTKMGTLLAQDELDVSKEPLAIAAQPETVEPDGGALSNDLVTEVKEVIVQLLEEEGALPKGTAKGKKAQQKKFINNAKAALGATLGIGNANEKNILETLGKGKALTEDILAKVEQIFTFPKLTNAQKQK